jgi:hypothetical protein
MNKTLYLGRRGGVGMLGIPQEFEYVWMTRRVNGIGLGIPVNVVHEKRLRNE